MATIEATRLNRQVLNSVFGNACITYGQVLNGAASGDEILVADLPAGARVLGVRVVNDAMGAGSQVSVGHRYKDPAVGAAAPTAFKAATAVSSAGAFRADFHPQAPLAGDAYITLTVSGGNLSASADLTAFVEYEFVGTP